jgi:hypothetical protein
MTGPRTPASAPADGPQPAALLVLNIPIGVIARRKHGERRGCRKQRHVVVTWRVEIDKDHLASMVNRFYTDPRTPAPARRAPSRGGGGA